MSRRRIGLLVAALMLGLCALFYRADIPFDELTARYSDGASRFLDLEGMRVHYKDEGSGPPLLLLHGTASSLHTWDGWAADLAGDFRVLRLDMPGFGLTGPDPTGDTSIERRTEVLAAFLDTLGAREPAVAGNSLGGYIAWQLAFRHPVRSLVLVDAAGYPRQRGLAVLDLGRIPILRGLLARLTPRFLIAAGVREAYGDTSKVNDALVDRHYQLLLRPGNRHALIASLATADVGHEAIRRISQPTLVMWGREDRLIPVAHAERFHRDLPTSELVVYDGVGHVPMEEIPERSAGDARAFLLAHGEPSVLSR